MKRFQFTYIQTADTDNCQVAIHHEQREAQTEIDDFENVEMPEESPLKSSISSLHASVLLHDYCGPVDDSSMSHTFNQSVQVMPKDLTELQDKAVQCGEKKSKFVDAFTQTGEIPIKSKDIGIQVRKPILTYEDVKGYNQKLMFYTGIPDSEIFDALLDEIKDDAVEQTARNSSDQGTGTCSTGRPRQLRIIDEFFMVLMRLRLGLYVEDLADRFCVAKSTCSVIVNRWIDYLDIQLSFFVKWASRNAVNDHMPQAFKDKYPKCRVIFDCTVIKTETPASLQHKSLMYSDYKSQMTWKGLIGISPAGVVTFVSDLWSGSVSDKVITKECNLLSLCEKGDAVMVDKGFVISDLTTPLGVQLIIPPFKHGKQQLSKREVDETRTIANLRIHVERQMERIKKFNILRTIIPISMTQQVSKIWKICTYLTNLQPPLCPK